MAAAETSGRAAGDGCSHMKLLCSHGGRLIPRGPDGAIRYVGGETRVLAVPRDASFRDLTRRLEEMAGGAEVRAVRHRLADEGLEDVTVSVTCDEELAHMRDEYDRLRATRPAARFRVFVTTAAAASGGGGVVQRGRSAAAGLPPLAPKMRRVQSEQAQLHRRPAYPTAPVRRVQSLPEFAGRLHAQSSLHHHQQQQQCCCCSCRRPTYPAPVPARPMHAAPYMSKKASAAPSMPAAKATGRVVFLTDAGSEKARSRDSQAAMERRRAIWEFE
nr:uncharacterized protein LOC117835205 [Setaria viridis]